MISFDPLGLALVALLAAVFWRAVLVLRWRGYDVPALQQAAWWGGVALVAIGLLGPPEALSDDLLSAHMAQHMLIADLAAPLLLAGARTPVLQFLLPRPILVPLARRRWLRAIFRTLRKPLVALPLFVLVLYGWHFRFSFQAALEHPLVHALQHWSFIVASILVWWSVVDPSRRRLDPELWKIGHVLGMRLAGMFLGMAFILMRTQAYPWYGNRAEQHGLSPLTDQQVGGGIMLGIDLVVMFLALGIFFWRSAAEHDRAEAAERAAASTPSA